MPKHPGGRPRMQVDWAKVDQLCAIMCTQEEISSLTGISVDTLDRHAKREHKMSFAEYYTKKSANGKASLRRRQYQMAIGTDTTPPNPTMLIWLGKQWLGQKEKNELSGPENEPLKIEVEFVPRPGK